MLYDHKEAYIFVTETQTRHVHVSGSERAWSLSDFGPPWRRDDACTPCGFEAQVVIARIRYFYFFRRTDTKMSLADYIRTIMWAAKRSAARGRFNACSGRIDENTRLLQLKTRGFSSKERPL
jgi:hypothetical protein